MRLDRLNPEVKRDEFTCGDSDLDEYYRFDAIEGAKQLLSVSYAIRDDAGTIVFFSLSNDSIRKTDLSSASRRRFFKSIPHRKRYTSMPAVKVGRLGVASSRQKEGYGTQALDFLKLWFTRNNKTGCRFLLVDAYNTDKVLNFYGKNKFEFLTTEDKDTDTRLMYFDLIEF